MVAIVLGVLIAAPTYALATENVANPQNGGAVCGRVNADPALIVAMLLDPTQRQAATVVASSPSEEIQTTVNIDGTYCFASLHTDLHVITGFGGSQNFRGSVTPVAGKTVVLDLMQQS